MFTWVQVATFRRLVELGANGECRLVPPKTPENVRRAALFAQPARRRDVRAPGRQIKTAFPFIRDCLVALDAHWSRIPGVVPVLACRFERNTCRCVPKRSPRKPPQRDPFGREVSPLGPGRSTEQ